MNKKVLWVLLGDESKEYITKNFFREMSRVVKEANKNSVSIMLR